MGPSDLRRLKVIGVALPVIFIVALETARFMLIESDPLHRAEHVALAAITGISVVVFALLMFYLIERAERHIVRQNRELAAVNAVSTAVQGELGVDQLIDSALHSVIETTGATEASVTVFPPEGQRDGGVERRVVVAEHASPYPAIGAEVPHLIDIPLSAGTAVVGRMRLHLPEGVAEPDLLASSTLQNIGHQLACSIQIGQLVADLTRRQREGHGLLDVLLQISNQSALADTLGAVVRHARDLLGGDESVICLNGQASRAVQLEGTEAALTVLADGTTCLSADVDRFAGLRERAPECPVRTSTEFAATLEAQIASADGVFGDLWVGRVAGAQFTERDGRFLTTLANLAAIAIAGARMRESERQGAILAERERIAREMHDSLAQVLGVTHMRLRALGGRAEIRSAPTIEDELTDLADLQEEAYRDVREAILGLRESSHAERGLLEGLRAYLAKYSHQSGVQTTLDTTLDREPALSPRTEVQVIRVIQEALTNVRKHSGAKSAVVRITNGEDATTFVVEDDGHGFDLTGALLGRDGGFGLHTMRERMELIGGTLTVDSAPGRGTRVIARVPGAPYAPTVPLEVNGAADGSDPDLARR